MAKKTYSGVTPANADPGLARYFEARPEHIFKSVVSKVIDASTALPKRKVEGVYVTSQYNIVASPLVTIGFGIPNAYLLVPDEERTGHDKFSAFSLWRKPAEVAPSSKTHELFQAGVQVIMLDAPVAAIDELQAEMRKLVGQKYRTCVRAVFTALHNAGFTAGSRPLNSYTWPAKAMTAIMRNGISWRGQRISLHIVRTGHAQNSETHAFRIAAAELHTISRHARKSLTPKAKAGSKVAQAGLVVVDNPDASYGIVAAALFLLGLSAWLWLPVALIAAYYLARRIVGADAEGEAAPTADGPPRHGDYATVCVSASMPSTVGMFFRWLWGSHAMFSASVNKVDIARYLPGSLKPFPQAKPSLGTRIKKKYLFRPLVIKIMRRFLCPKFALVGTANERDLFRMMRTHSEKSENKYNLVTTRSGQEWNLTLARIDVGQNFLSSIGLGFIAKLMDWILSKHVLMSGYAEVVPFCGEAWKGEDGVIYISGNSGTYQPTDEDLDAFISCLRETFPHLQFAKVGRDGKPVSAPVVA